MMWQSMWNYFFPPKETNEQPVKTNVTPFPTERIRRNITHKQPRFIPTIRWPEGAWPGYTVAVFVYKDSYTNLKEKANDN